MGKLSLIRGQRKSPVADSHDVKQDPDTHDSDMMSKTNKTLSHAHFTRCLLKTCQLRHLSISVVAVAGKLKTFVLGVLSDVMRYGASLGELRFLAPLLGQQWFDFLNMNVLRN